VGGVSQAYDFNTAPSLRTHDGRATWVVIHEITVEDGRARIRLSTASTSVASMLGFFLGGEPALTQPEVNYLDAVGNDNGQYDVGDLRMWLREGPVGG